MTTTDIAQRVTVRQMVDEIQRAEALVRRAFVELEEQQGRLGVIFSGSWSVTIEASRGTHQTSWDVDRAVARLRRQAWQHIVERLELRRMMSVKAWDQLQHDLEHKVPLEITDETVMQMHRSVEAHIPAMLKAAAREVFDWLRPVRGSRSVRAQYKRNRVDAVAHRVVIPMAVDPMGKAWLGFRFRYDVHQELIALENVFNNLAGKGSVNKHHQSELVAALDRRTGLAETEHFRVKACQNGNVHLTFKDLDLLAQFNRLAGGGQELPPERARTNRRAA